MCLCNECLSVRVLPGSNIFRRAQIAWFIWQRFFVNPPEDPTIRTEEAADFELACRGIRLKFFFSKISRFFHITTITPSWSRV